MNTEQLLRAIDGKKEISIEQDIVVNIGAFQTGTNDCSFESLLLTLNNHQPIKRYSFDIKKLENWCEENNLIFYIDELNRIVHLRRKSQYSC